MKRVFVIEDDELMREVIGRYLGRHDCETTTFATATEALPRIVAERPDLVLSDVNMPGISGLELARRLGAQGHRVPVILMTAHVDDALEVEARELGVQHVFAKPFRDVARLQNAVLEAIDGSDAERSESFDGMRLELLSNLSHQLRTPLTATRLALDGLFTEMGDTMDPSQRQLADISRRNIDRLVELVDGQLRSLNDRIERAVENGSAAGVLVAAASDSEQS